MSLPSSSIQPETGMPSSRRFPAPWSAELTPNCFIVRDADGQQLAYVYFEEEPGRRSATKLRTTPLSFHLRTAAALRMHDLHTSLRDRLGFAHKAPRGGTFLCKNIHFLCRRSEAAGRQIKLFGPHGGRAVMTVHMLPERQVFTAGVGRDNAQVRSGAKEALTNARALRTCR
jgi:hypothetical protein